MTNEQMMAFERVTDATLVLIAAARSTDEAVKAFTRTLEAVGDTLPNQPPSEQPEALQPVDTSSIRALVVSMFTPDELHRFSRFNTPVVSGRIAWNRTSMNSIAFDYVEALERDRCLTAAFFKALVAKAPARKKEIRRVQNDYKAGGNAYA